MAARSSVSSSAARKLSAPRPGRTRELASKRKNPAGRAPARGARSARSDAGKATPVTRDKGRTAPTARKSQRAPAKLNGTRAQRSGTCTGTSCAKSGSRRKASLANPILLPTIVLLLGGLVMVLSASFVASSEMGAGGYRTFWEQAFWAFSGLLLLYVCSRLDYHFLARISLFGVFLSMGLLALLLFFGKEVNGARRCFDVGFSPFSPTEFVRIALIVFSAHVIATKSKKMKGLRHLVVPIVVLVVLAAGLMLAQPDLGSALVLCFSVMLLLILAPTNSSHLFALGSAGGALAVLFAYIAPYRRARLFSFMHPWKSSEGYGYHVIQSSIALGSGNLKGLGPGMSRQKFLYLPNAHNDFIFAIIGEEFGIAGTLTVLCLMVLFAWAGLRIAINAPDELGRLLAIGITGSIVIQALVNMGGVVGLLPITGVPLPLVSSGGMSIFVCLGSIGILLNIAALSKPRGR